MSQDFYTNVQIYGSRILYRGIENGRKVRRKIDYFPTFFVPSKEKTEHTTIHGEYVSEIKPGNIREARDFVKQYEDVDGFKIYGNNKYEYAFIGDTFPNDIEWDLSHINITNIDIEVGSENGFPEPASASEPITAITFKNKGKFVVLGCGVFNNNRDDVCYIKCRDEADLLKRFLDEWTADYPDIITGWNCIPVDSFVWKKDKIVKIKDLIIGDSLYDSVVKNISPVNKKRKYEIKLANGTILHSSIDHTYNVKRVPKGKYSNLEVNPKSHVEEMDISLDKVDLEKHSYYVPVPKRENTNPDNNEYTDDDLYMMGLCYSDGTRHKNTHGWANSLAFYNNDKNLLEFAHNYKVKNCKNTRMRVDFRDDLRRVRLPIMKQSLIDLIYAGDNNIKCLNVELLSTLSKRQFLHFLSGIIDGDGSKCDTGYGFVDFTEDGIKKFSVLLSWNGIFHFCYKNSIRITKYDDDDLVLFTKHSGKIDDSTRMVERKNTSSNNIKYRFIDGTYWIKIDDIIDTEETVDMMDIETDSSYFIYNGVKVHNCKFFDIPYLVNRITKIIGESEAKRLSPWNNLDQRIITMMGREQTAYIPSGISVLDYIELYKKFAPGGQSQESYKLDAICNVELGERKLSYEEYGSLHTLYKDNYQKFIEYNIRDVELVGKLEDKLRLIELALTLAYDSKSNYDDVFTQTRMWDAIIYNYLLKRKVVVPPITKNTKTESFVGAYVKNPILGLHHWVASFDLNSLYPSLIRQYNISPDSHVTAEDINMRIAELERALKEKNITKI
jgi:hypothetical protein